MENSTAVIIAMPAFNQQRPCVQRCGESFENRTHSNLITTNLSAFLSMKLDYSDVTNPTTNLFNQTTFNPFPT
jgi:hypothetical protein